jgi:putative oxidoreductase
MGSKTELRLFRGSSRTDATSLLLRAVVGPIFMAQGWRKCLSPRDAPHGLAVLQGTLRKNHWPYPELLASMTGATELVCGCAVLLGWRTRVATVPLLGILSVAIAQVKWPEGFIGGWDWPYAVAGSVGALALMGSGQISVDELMCQWHRRGRASL